MSDSNNLGEVAYLAYMAALKHAEQPAPWHILAPEVRKIWEDVSAAVVLRLCQLSRREWSK